MRADASNIAITLGWRDPRPGEVWSHGGVWRSAAEAAQASAARPALKGLPREKVLAVVVSLLDATWVRIGNREYARDNNSFGLTTLRDRHVRFIRDGRAVLSFRGKSGTPHDIVVDDKRIAKDCARLSGSAGAAAVSVHRR